MNFPGSIGFEPILLSTSSKIEPAGKTHKRAVVFYTLHIKKRGFDADGVGQNVQNHFADRDILLIFLIQTSNPLNNPTVIQVFDKQRDCPSAEPKKAACFLHISVFNAVFAPQ
jgi:hypothetical protein